MVRSGGFRLWVGGGVYKPKTEDRKPKTKDREVLKRFFRRQKHKID